jgi:thiosulfate/3-mercaptopyruvate sulfurtransferase
MTDLPPFVDVGWLRDHPEAVLADVRWYLDGRSGRAEYEAGHIPAAVYVELEEWLAAPASDAGGRHPLPAPEVFAEGMGTLGIGDDTTVVAYDDAGGAVAARLVWMLRVTGRSAALLDGGLDAWDGPLETEPASRLPARFSVRPWPAEALAGIDDAAEAANVVLDGRERERYLGAAHPVDPRAGHIPGARSLPARENVGPDGRLLPAGELRERLAAVGATSGAPVVSYCGSGVTACHTLLVLEQLGLGPGRLFPGSWSQWSRDPSRPLATGDEAHATAPPR